MGRYNPQDRLDLLIEAAIKVFMRVGYRRAQIADIAREMGVAPGTVYLYVKSKEALFDLALQQAFGNTLTIDPNSLPLHTPTAAEILARVEAQFADRMLFPPLRAVTSEENSVAQTTADVSAMISELYQRVYRRRRVLSIIEASALDWPELFELYYGVRRDLLFRLTEYLESGIRAKRLRPVPDTPASARLILETIAWFAYHRAGDPEPDNMNEEIALATVVDALVNAYIQK